LLKDMRELVREKNMIASFGGAIQVDISTDSERTRVQLVRHGLSLRALVNSHCSKVRTQATLHVAAQSGRQRITIRAGRCKRRLNGFRDRIGSGDRRDPRRFSMPRTDARCDTLGLAFVVGRGRVEHLSQCMIPYGATPAHESRPER
jgi:hypothetical protein